MKMEPDKQGLKDRLKGFFTWKNTNTKWYVGVFLLLFLIGFVRQCLATELEVGGGVSAGTFMRENGQPPRAGVAEASVRSTNNYWDLSVGYVGEQYDFISSYVYVSGQYIVSFHPAPSVTPFLGLGLSWHKVEYNVSYLLPLPTNFSLSAGLDIVGRWRIEGRHFSNAGLKDGNRGQNLLLIGYRF